MDVHGDALKRILGDMDGLEGKKMFPMPEGNGGATITISVTPNGGESEPQGDNDGDEFPEGHDESMCKGGCAYHKGGMVKEEASAAEELPGVPKMAEGGMIGNPAMGETEDLSLPPFLRKKRGLGVK